MKWLGTVLMVLSSGAMVYASEASSAWNGTPTVTIIIVMASVLLAGIILTRTAGQKETAERCEKHMQSVISGNTTAMTQMASSINALNDQFKEMTVTSIDLEKLKSTILTDMNIRVGAVSEGLDALRMLTSENNRELQQHITESKSVPNHA